jgi:hypothetical protein
MSEPQHIKEILPDVMQDIARRMELNRQKKVLSAVSDYYQNRRQGRPRGRRRAKGGQRALRQPRIEIL